MPYGEEDADYFFGRDLERELIAANLMASRLTLLYGPSGVGKTSVLQAGVVHDLRREAQRNFTELGCPEFAVVVLRSWRGDPATALSSAAHIGVAQAMGGESAQPLSEPGNLNAILSTWSRRLNGELFVILDQFEEYFLYHPDDDGDHGFAAELSRAVNNPDLPANFLVSLRDDALSQLDRFKGRIPGLFDNYLRIDRLNRESGRRAIEGPVERFNEQRSEAEEPVSIEPELVEAVLDQVEAGRVAFGQEGQGAVFGTDSAGRRQSRIETPYLQLVMQRLWREKAGAASHCLRRQTLDTLGGADQIVRTHLDQVMERFPGKNRETARAIFHHLVTPSGAKIGHTVADLAHYAERDEDEVAVVLEELCSHDARVLRPVAIPERPEDTRYEIYHDVLATAILDWRQRDLLQAESEKRAATKAATEVRWRFERLTVTAGFIIAEVVFLALVYIGLNYSLNRSFDAVLAQVGSLGREASLLYQRPDAEQIVVRTGVIVRMREQLNKEAAGGLLGVIDDGTGTILRIYDSGLFASGTAEIKEASRPLIRRIGALLNEEPGPQLITGHTDDQPIRTSKFPSNWHLSLARAKAVKDLLSESLSDPKKLIVEGRASSEPVAANDTAEGRRRNRRIEIRVPAR